MKPGGIWKHVVVAFALALGLYLAAFWAIEYTRQKKGPWVVRFQTGGDGEPRVSVSQKTLKVQRLAVQFPGERASSTNLDETIVFDHPITEVPFGKVQFLDTTFLPGTVALDIFGHEIQLLPRVLTVDGRELEWKPQMGLSLKPEDKLPARKK